VKSYDKQNRRFQAAAEKNMDEAQLHDFRSILLAVLSVTTLSKRWASAVRSAIEGAEKSAPGTRAFWKIEKDIEEFLKAMSLPSEAEKN
jgi:hypothetical protein